MNINWFPGHMKKTVDSLKESAKLVDLVVELLDARIPYSSENPMIEDIFSNKCLITVLNKSDLSDSIINMKWIDYFKGRGRETFLLNSLDRNSMKNLIQKIQRIECGKKISGRKKIMVVGIPNVGKSTFINSLSKRKGTKTGNRPGVTTSIQWIKTDFNIDLLDTPGVLWHKFENQNVGINLALTGAIKDNILDIEELSLILLKKIRSIEESALQDKYKIETFEKTELELLDEIAKKRGMLLKGGEVDYFKVSNHIINDFRKGEIKKISLEEPGGIDV